jgi:phage major head subunit gpT-like protein
MLITPASIDQFFQRLDFSFMEAMRAVPSFWQKLATEVPSVTEANIYPFLAGLPQVREWLGPRVLQNIALRAYTVPNKHFELTVAIDKNKFEDDTYGMYAQWMPLYAQSVAEFRDRAFATSIEAGVTELAWDNQYFFDTDHSVNPDNSGSGVNVNKFVGAGYDIAVADPLVPFAAARAAAAAWKRDDGLPLGAVPDLIMVHPNEEIYALKIAHAVMTAQAVGSAAAGVSNVYQGKVDVLVNPYLTVTSGRPWYLFCTNRGIKPFLWQNRQPPQFVQRTAVTDDNVFKLRQFEWGVDFRGAPVYTFPGMAYRFSAS